MTDYQVNVTPYIYNETGLAGSWHFSESSGNATADSSGFGNNANYVTAVSTTSGRFGKAMNFSKNAGQYITTLPTSSTSASYPAGYSVVLWIKQASTSAADNDQVPISKTWDSANGGFLFQTGLASNRVLINEGGACQLSAGTTYSLYAWHQIGFTYSSNGTVITFLDGSPDQKTTTCGPMHDQGYALRIGDDSHNNGRYYEGSVDEVRIYNRTLAPHEVLALYNATKARLDYADIRFTDSSNNLLPFWMESDGKFWVKVPSVPTTGTTIYAYLWQPAGNRRAERDRNLRVLRRLLRRFEQVDRNPKLGR